MKGYELNRRKPIARTTAAGSVNLMRATKIFKNEEEETCSIANEKNMYGAKTIL